MRVVSWNLRFDSQPDAIDVEDSLKNIPDPLEAPKFMGKKGEQPWSIRRIRVAQELGSNIVIAAFQEALKRQVTDLAKLLGDEWEWVGVGRDDGREGGEYGPIFYNKCHFELLEWDTFWLSETPFTPSRYPGAGSYRIATVARFATKGNPDADKKCFTFINTHLDERSEDQRKLGASLLLHRCHYEASVRKEPVFVVGDFNSEQEGRDSGAYRVLTGADSPVAVPAEFRAKFEFPPGSHPHFKMLDLRAETPRVNVTGFFRTFTGFIERLGWGGGGRIDYILGSSAGGWSSNRYETPNVTYDDGVMASDHRPVYATIRLD
ncbi:hypothetical protein M407DRAFT_200465 [Tulasnella calospora MUT 4182]|uniref:Endonuclease/exonuclease/phosphatase domain-containing protein n=1 Tax=Tulasnella calospora MUT 4182 TaxID=1051891 RepID=A0A0C3LYF0_9AGAM|nr:hypothetical protein M407DRAFT_200465 [Tulasnella calospora MUT 4182]